jgi:hypothetical protein
MRTISTNDRGYRIGEDHPNAKLTDSEVELVRQLHEGGMIYADLAEKFEVSKWSISRICRYELRNQAPSKFRTIEE